VIDLAAFEALAAGKSLDEDRNCQWRIARAPNGDIAPEDFAWVEEPIPEPGPGEVLLRTLYLGLAPVMRMYMQGTGATGEQVLRPGDVIHGRGVAQVVKSRHPDWPDGSVVQGQIGWQTWKVSAMTPPERMMRCPDFGLPAMLACKVLGMTGLSAHAGLFACGDPRAGDRMVLSGAAGGVGSIVSQLAANVVGCDVVGIAGGAEKCAALVRDLGCSAAIDYKAGDLRERLDALRPDGINLYFDNVGGDMLAAVLDRLALHARVVLCGSIGEYVRDTPFGLTNYTRLRGKDATMRGFFVYNHLDRWDAVIAELAGYISDGRLKPVQDVETGFPRMPYALAKLYAGANIGTQLCSVRGEPGEWG
jgi:NADPH-dependent curcumin reductase CurA